jgi:hypothetical protein
MTDRRTQVAALGLAAALTIAACAAPLGTVERSCGTGPNASICAGRMRVPETRVDEFRRAGQIAIDRVFSPEFERGVRDFMAARARQPDMAEDWSDWTPETVVATLRSEIPGAELGTWDDPQAWVWKRLFNTLAFDAKPPRPAVVNRWGLPGRSAASLANTIVHEAAHKGGMTHVGADRECGPPYVVGTLVERLEEGAIVHPDSLC